MPVTIDGTSGITTPAISGLTTPVGISSGGTNITTYTTGDVIYASATNTLSKLGIGSPNQVLTVSGGVPAWATPATPASGLTLLQTVTGTSASTIDITGFSNTYKNYRILGINIRNDSGSFSTDLRATADLGSGYVVLTNRAILANQNGLTTSESTSQMFISYGAITLYGTQGSGLVMDITGRTDPSMNMIWTTSIATNSSSQAMAQGCAQVSSTTTIVGLRFFIGNGGNTMTGTFKLYGYQN